MSGLIPVVLCGGTGSRLWPVSREQDPKPFMALDDGESLLRKTYARAAGLAGVREIVTVTNRDFLSRTVDEFETAKKTPPRATFILEPFGRNTTAAVAMAALVLARTRGTTATLLVTPADHLIRDLDAFGASVGRAMELARSGRIVTFGIRPSSAHTGYGYIEHEGVEIRRFMEKPDARTARAFVESGRFLWNSGLLCVEAGVMLDEMARLCPDLLEAARASLDGALATERGGTVRLELPADAFRLVPDIPIDRAVLEKTGLGAVVPSDFGWSDVGCWASVSELARPDERGNRVTGRAVLHDTRNCYVRSDRLVGTVGVQDLMVIDTPDALLVARRDGAQEVRQLFARLKADGHEVHRTHRTVHRPWGTYTILDEGDGFKVKRIEVKPHGSLSLQMHRHRGEHWVVVRGSACVVNGMQSMLLDPGEATHIAPAARHRLTNPCATPLVLVEIQCGHYLGEDDIVRFEDVYGRV